MAMVMVVLICCVGLNGCCVFTDCTDGPAPKGDIVQTYTERKFLSPNAAINRMVTSLSMKCVMVFGSESPCVKKEFMSDDEVFNYMPAQVFRKLVRSKSVTSSLISDEKCYKLKSSMKSNAGVLVWSLELIDLNEKLIWRKVIEVKLEKLKKVQS